LNKDRKSAQTLRLLILSLLLAISLAIPQQVSGSTALPSSSVRAPNCIAGCSTISGSPLSIVVGKDTSYQVYYNGPNGRLTQVYQPLFDEADSGLFVRYGSWIIGPDFWNHMTSAANTYDPWTNTSQTSVLGNGTDSSPWTIDTKVVHEGSGVSLTARTSYVNGSNFFRIDWDVCTPQAGQAIAYLAADFYMQGGDRDLSYGVFDASSGSVGAANQELTWLQTFTPLTPATRYFAGAPADLWGGIGAQGAPGPGFNNAVNGAPIDNAAGLQWDLSVSGCARVSSHWRFGGTATGRTVIFVPNVYTR
jgi:hypothetical protein